MTIHAAGYDRQSEERRDRSSASPATQRAANRNEVAKRAERDPNIIWVGHFSEKPGTSAFSGERPVFERMLSECRAGRINMIVVMYVSRFSRMDPLDAIPVVTELLNLGVTIVSTTEGEFRKGNLMDLIHLIMRLDAAYNESRNKSEAVGAAHNLARSLGGVVGKVAYGFDFTPVAVPNPADGNRLVVIQKPTHNRREAENIRWMWRTIKTHMGEPFKPERGVFHPGSLNGLCHQMNRDGVPTKGANVGMRTANSTWDPAVVKRILRDPWIAGFQRDPIFRDAPAGRKKKSVIGYTIRRDPVTKKPLTLECGPIVPPDEWFELQEWLDGRGRGKGTRRGGYLLTAMEVLYCESGHVMVGHKAGSTPGRNNFQKVSYECKKRKGVQTGHPGACTIHVPTLDDYVVRRVFALVAAAEYDESTQEILAAATKRFSQRQEAPAIASERRSLVSERADAVRALEELYEDREAGAYDNPVGRRRFVADVQAYSASIEAADARLVELDYADSPELPIFEWLGEPGSDPIGPGSWWHSATHDERRDFLRLFVDRIEIQKAYQCRVDVTERVTIVWAKPPIDEDAGGSDLALVA
jgi:DNA invertase Pin-like site-specific DNA recombinase